MADYTRFTNLEVTGELRAGAAALDLTAAKVTAADAAAAAGTAPTKAEYDAVVTLVNALKAEFNKLVGDLSEE